MIVDGTDVLALDLLALLHQEPHRVLDDAQVLVTCDPQHLLQVQVPGLAHDRRDRSEAVGQTAKSLVAVGRGVATTGHPEGGHLHAVHVLPLERGEQLPLFGIGRREARLQVVHAELAEAHGDRNLLPDGQAHTLALLAIAQRRVIDGDAVHAVPSWESSV